MIRGGARLTVTELRRAARQPVDRWLVAERPNAGDVRLHVINVSAQGFMIDQADGITLGNRVIVRLPHIGRIEGYCMWTRDIRAGFQFERILRTDDFAALVAALGAKAIPRARR